jgi:hypothetical protein
MESSPVPAPSSSTRVLWGRKRPNDVGRSDISLPRRIADPHVCTPTEMWSVIGASWRRTGRAAGRPRHIPGERASGDLERVGDRPSPDWVGLVLRRARKRVVSGERPAVSTGRKARRPGASSGASGKRRWRVRPPAAPVPAMRARTAVASRSTASTSFVDASSSGDGSSPKSLASSHVCARRTTPFSHFSAHSRSKGSEYPPSLSSSSVDSSGSSSISLSPSPSMSRSRPGRSTLPPERVRFFFRRCPCRSLVSASKSMSAAVKPPWMGGMYISLRISMYPMRSAAASGASVPWSLGRAGRKLVGLPQPMAVVLMLMVVDGAMSGNFWPRTRHEWGQPHLLTQVRA